MWKLIDLIFWFKLQTYTATLNDWWLLLLEYLLVNVLATELRMGQRAVAILSEKKNLKIKAQEIICECLTLRRDEYPAFDRTVNMMQIIKRIMKLDKTFNEVVPNYKSYVVTIFVVVLAMWYFFVRVSVDEVIRKINENNEKKI